jgi:hypothetical protein
MPREVLFSLVDIVRCGDAIGDDGECFCSYLCKDWCLVWTYRHLEQQLTGQFQYIKAVGEGNGQIGARYGLMLLSCASSPAGLQPSSRSSRTRLVWGKAGTRSKVDALIERLPIRPQAVMMWRSACASLYGCLTPGMTPHVNSLLIRAD